MFYKADFNFKVPILLILNRLKACKFCIDLILILVSLFQNISISKITKLILLINKDLTRTHIYVLLLFFTTYVC